MQQGYPLISVVMCTFNGEKYLVQQLDSILAQDYTPLELIICDDVSTDGTVSILQQYAARDNRIKVYVNERNLGYNRNFEQAIRLASADWIAIADQDDIWLPGKLTSLYQCIEEGTLLVHSYNAEFKNNDPSVTFVNRSRLRFKGDNVRELFFYNTVSGHTMLLHKKLLAAALPVPAGVYYDWWIGINAAVQGRVILNYKALVLHRQHSSNASHISRNLSEESKKATFFKDRIATLESFRQIKDLSKGESDFLKAYIHLLKNEWTKSFSWPVYFFFLKHARTAFYYRRKKFMAFYYLKYSLQRASMKVKHWT
ncbi:MAG TPA: glycosyltransferase family 2 protein [Chitinophagaceae bacterium]|nr:glycosyltransferase family 2 protein [Chitinophagaceae bacterium]